MQFNRNVCEYSAFDKAAVQSLRDVVEAQDLPAGCAWNISSVYFITDQSF